MCYSFYRYDLFDDRYTAWLRENHPEDVPEHIPPFFRLDEDDGVIMAMMSIVRVTAQEESMMMIFLTCQILMIHLKKVLYLRIL